MYFTLNSINIDGKRYLDKHNQGIVDRVERTLKVLIRLCQHSKLKISALVIYLNSPVATFEQSENVAIAHLVRALAMAGLKHSPLCTRPYSSDQS